MGCPMVGENRLKAYLLAKKLEKSRRLNAEEAATETHG